MKSVVVVLVTLLALASSAAAQPALTPPLAPPGSTMPAVPRAREIDVPQKSEGTAMMWALGSTALGYLAASAGDGGSDNAVLPWIAAAGILAGPSAGHIYAGENGHAVKMTLLRTGAMAVFVAGLVKSITVGYDDCIDYCGNNDQNARNNGEMMMLAGAATFIGATIYDIIDAPRAARRFNAKQKEQRMWQVAPTMSRDAGGGIAPAFAVSGRW